MKKGLKFLLSLENIKMGKIFLELGTEQTKNVQNIMETAGLTSLKTAIDIGGRERCLVLTN